ncbi:MAG: (d)CMP kinase [Thermoanaerobaculia bacterium]
MTESPPVVVAIDGPSGVGKSAVARELARRLGLPVLETGAMYRAVGWKVLEEGLDPSDCAAVERLVARLDLELEADGEGRYRVSLAGRPCGEELYRHDVAQATSRVARIAAVRRDLVRRQREAALRAGAVVEGRDIGTVVFPETPFKFFLQADARVRAERRWRQENEAGGSPDFEEILAAVEERDARDAGRDLSPLRHDESYVVVDTSRLSLEEVVGALERTVSARRGNAS